MNLLLKLWLSLAAMLLLAACYTQTGTVSRDPMGYISFRELESPVSVIIDDGTPIALERSRVGARIPVSPGKHQIRVMVQGVERVNREILVSDQQTLEVSIP